MMLKGFYCRQIEGNPGFEGTVADDGGVRVSFLMEIDGCPGGAESCEIKSCGTVSDAADSVVVWCKEFNYTPQADSAGEA